MSLIRLAGRLLGHVVALVTLVGGRVAGALVTTVVGGGVGRLLGGVRGPTVIVVAAAPR
ncbi:MAG: hypothetical protein R2697_20045 [Ilumatobacteraceae bacterium]